MAEFEEKLNAILGDSDAMGQIVSIAKALTSGNDSADATPLPQDDQWDATPSPRQDETGDDPDWSSLLGLFGTLGGGNGDSSLSALGDLDPRLIQGALTLFGEYSATDNRKIALLNALKPFLKESRYAKVDKAIQIAKLSRVVRVAFRLFKQNGGDGDV